MGSTFENIIGYLISLFTTRFQFFPSFIQTALFIIIFCTVAFWEQIFFIFFRRFSQKWQSKAEKKWREKITNMVAHIIVYGDDEDTESIIANFLPRFLKLPLGDKKIRTILKKELLTYHANFTGQTAAVLREFYVRLNLEKEARRNLRSRYWDKQIEAIRELTQMSIRDSVDTILKYTDDENAQLRMEAQTAFVKLSTEEPFRFLDRAKERILDWHQLVLFEVITKTENIQIPSFSAWLSSKNHSVILLCIKLIDHFQQFEAIPKLILLLNHPVVEVRRMAIRSLAKMEAEMAEDSLHSIYQAQPLSIKLDILDALGRIASGNYMHFLTQQLSASEFKIRMYAARALKAHGRAGQSVIDQIFPQQSAENQAIIKHVLDDRIKV